MGILAMNIKSIEGNKYENITDKAEINNRIAVTNIKEKNIPNIKLPCVSIEFNFTSKYTSEEKTFAEISIIGEIIYTGNDNGEILKKWKESKELLQTQYTSIINTIFKRCAIKALQLTEDLQLPPLIGFPFVDNKKE
ncbi:MAG: hypothetical protein KJ697_02585 [Nanoarchaeota archaeon]|nr:hypothetical protein [Nanoarchaeota archaeon]MBU4124012.1 hypothetical protein [Nanoarchaeota archaeon]